MIKIRKTIPKSIITYFLVIYTFNLMKKKLKFYKKLINLLLMAKTLLYKVVLFSGSF